MTPVELAEVMEATWPPARRVAAGPFLLREGLGGGKRVSAATAEAAFTEGDLDRAEAGMRALGQEPLFLIRAGDEVLDTALTGRGYAIVDPVVAYAAPVDGLAQVPPAYMTSFAHWPPLAIARSLWAEGGIGPARLAVMERAGVKTCILARTGDRPVGVAFVACHQGTAMLHALEVTVSARRQGSAHNILRAAAAWAQDQGATTFALVVTVANAPARALYASLGMQIVGQYHYRVK